MKRLLLRVLKGLLALVALVIGIFFAFLLIPVPEPPTVVIDDRPILLSGGLIVDIEKDSLLQQSVLIEQGRIAGLGPTDSLDIPADARVIDVSGQYLIPGLWDMHVHLLPYFSEQLTLPLFLAFGSTNVRELGGGPDYTTKKELDRQIREGQLFGPRFQALTGRMVGYLESEDAAVEVINRFPGQAPDHVKVYNAVLPDPFFRLMQEAQNKGVPVLGHKPRAVSAFEAVPAGIKSFEHARLFLFECYPGAAELREAYRAIYAGEASGSWLDSPERLQEMMDTHSDSMFIELADLMVEHNTWFCPTHITRKMDAFADQEDYRNTPYLRYIHFIQERSWHEDAGRMVDNAPEAAARQTYMDFYEHGLELTGQAHRRGVKVLAGTDANDTYAFPGYGLHEELEELVKAGLSPANALASATILPAEYFDQLDSHGSIAVGKVADIVLLEANPLEDITNTQGIQSIIFDGNHYDRQKLDEVLAFVEDQAGSWSLAVHFFWKSLTE